MQETIVETSEQEASAGKLAVAQESEESVRSKDEKLTYANNAITTITQRITHISTVHNVDNYPDIDDEISTWELQLAEFIAAHPTESLTANNFATKLSELKVAVSQNRPQSS